MLVGTFFCFIDWNTRRKTLWAYRAAKCARALRCPTLGRNGLTTAHGLTCVGVLGTEWDWRRVAHCSSTAVARVNWVSPRDVRREERTILLLCWLVNWASDVEKLLNGPSLAMLIWVCLRNRSTASTISISSDKKENLLILTKVQELMRTVQEKTK
jgi:hypothetical protein